MKDHLTPCGVKKYEDWLGTYLRQGGRVTHEYDYPMPRAVDLFEARDGLVITPRYGSRSLSIIVPRSVSFSVLARGHNNIYGYDKDGEAYVLGGFVPTFSDVRARKNKAPVLTLVVNRGAVE